MQTNNLYGCWRALDVSLLRPCVFTVNERSQMVALQITAMRDRQTAGRITIRNSRLLTWRREMRTRRAASRSCVSLTGALFLRERSSNCNAIPKRKTRENERSLSVYELREHLQRQSNASRRTLSHRSRHR